MTITVEEFATFCRRSLDGALEVVDRLGDGHVNLRPAQTNGNSPYALVTHMLGAAEWWVSHIVLGEPSDRQRDLEFVAAGSCADLRETTRAWLDLLDEQVPALSTTTTLAKIPSPGRPLEGEWTVGAALLHVYEEIAQHLGHLEITADLLLRNASERQST